MKTVFITFLLPFFILVACRKEDAESLLKSSIAKAHQGKFDEALVEMGKVVKLDPTPEHYVVMGDIYSAKHFFQAAIECYSKAIVLDSTYADAYYKKAVDCMNVTVSQECLDTINKCISLDSSTARNYSIRAGIKSELGDLEGACTDGQKAIQLGDLTLKKQIEAICKNVNN